MPTRKEYVVYTTVMCAIAMTIIDGVVQPSYAIKSAIKVFLFLVMPLGYFALFRAWGQLKSLFFPRKRDLLIALALGIGAFGLIIGGYALISRFFDLDTAILQLTSDGGVGPENFIYVSTYIALVNSMLEEFFFRGFAFLTAERKTSRVWLFSALAFALYHVAIMDNWFHPIWFGLFIAGLAVAGMFFDWLDRRGTIWPAWLVHMAANLAINLIGMRMFGIL